MYTIGVAYLHKEKLKAASQSFWDAICMGKQKGGRIWL